ncbi:MAG: alpha-2-macroglobulin [Planctomycetaceae bacterium]|nr:alpha-2-macroglobulin [Planctomycetaceae bacterium]
MRILPLACLICLGGAGLSLILPAAAEPPADPSQRGKYEQSFKAGNFKEAYEGFRALALDPKADRKKVGSDLAWAINALQQLGRVDEIDEFREAVIDVHKANWWLLQAAATTYINSDHQGFIVAGKFYRGGRRGGGGNYVNTLQRDRVRALQLMQQALPLARADDDKPAVAEFHVQFANAILSGAGHAEAWRLQTLTDLSQLPDYEEGRMWWRGNSGTQGAPVDALGQPVLHQVPASYEAAATDGERWRWMLAQSVVFNPSRRSEVQMIFANFLREQFGVQTMAQFGRWFGGADDGDDDTKENESGTYALHTLGDDETIARLATGIKRFKLPDEFNFIRIYQQVADRGKSEQGEQALTLLCQTFEDRRQYVKAAEYWKRLIKEYGPGDNNHRQERLKQIVGNWGRFENRQTQPAGQGATLDFRFRNAKKVIFEAWEVNVEKLLADVKEELKKANLNQIDWNKINVADLGFRVVQQNEQKYLGNRIATWDLALKPRPDHIDDRVTVATPLQKPGAYLVTARMDGGNVSRIIVWVADTVIAKKQLDGKSYYYVADAVTGRPVAKANVEYFGWKQVQVAPNQNKDRIVTANFAEATDNDGQVILDDKRLPEDNQWLITARTKAGRLAYLGFTNVWYEAYYDDEYSQTKVFTITDRPVYRPAQTVKFKVWVANAKFDQPDQSPFANQQFTVQINDPKGEKVFERVFTSDEYGGLDGEYPLPTGATLGVYGLQVVNHGGGNFRVEEYKKPEFEVKVEAPKEPVRLGEKITATIEAKYYFGAPVTGAKVKYKVLRTNHDGAWHPAAAWDWYYGKGYWWFAADYRWYPGWRSWGCLRPIPAWWGRPQQPPEVVSENEVDIGPDGKVLVEIDTLPAKELHGDVDHSYSITAEVVDESRRTIVGTGNVLVARKPFKVFAWVDRGHYRTGDTIKARFQAHTLDQKPVAGKGELTLYQVSYDDKQQPLEKAVETWQLDTDPQGQAQQQFKAAEKGQYRLSYKVSDAKGHSIEGGYVFVVTGEGFDGHEFRFNDIELVTDKREYAPGETVKLLINTNRAGGAVVLFLRPAHGIYLPPKVIRLEGKSTIEEVAVVQKDMPNFFIEAMTVAAGKLHTEVREVIVPPEQRVINVAVLPSQEEYKPGAPATVKVQLTDLTGEPIVGSTVLSIYDKSVEYISGGSNVPEIREFFWKWRRNHHPQTESTLDRTFYNLLRNGEVGMSNLGVFGDQVVEEFTKEGAMLSRAAGMGGGVMRKGAMMRGGAPGGPQAMAAPMAIADRMETADGDATGAPPSQPGGEGGGGLVEPTVRSQFADTAYWAAAILTDKQGRAEIAMTMPENLTGWKVKAWSMGAGTRVGQGEAEIVTKKNLLVRLQAPRFFVETDEVVLSANVHNYLKTAKSVQVALEIDGGTLTPTGGKSQTVEIEAGGQERVDWRVKVTGEGVAVVRMKALSDEESDAMQMQFPVYVHGMLKLESFAGVIRPDQDTASVTLTVPAQRRVNDSRIEVRYSPTLAGAMVDALPYMVEYPYGCTEQTLNRFLPTVITQNILLKMKLNLKDIQEKQTNLNAQEIGDDRERAKGWKRFDRNPVFDEAEVRQMVKDGLQALTNMQLADGGWGWFSGYGEHSWPHTTALVVHGLQVAAQNDVALVPGILERGVEWLKTYQARQVQLLKNAADKKANREWKEQADNIDALIYMVLIDADVADNDMLEFLYRDRTKLAVYSKAMFGLALHKQQQPEKLAMILENIEQFVVEDDENQTAYLKLPENNSWWFWYGSENEAHAYYLKLLAKTSPQARRTSRLVKYLLNNRKHATYWNSTRDTAICIEALAEYMAASGEDKPDLTLEVWLDGKKQKEVKIAAKNLFTFDNKFVLTGDAVETGKHTVELRRKGVGPVYFNAYLTNFTLEDFITRAGLEVKVGRKYYKLTRVDKTVKVAGARGQAADQKVEKYERSELVNLATLKSGDLVEIELEIDSKNDYEYVIFEDMKASGFEPVELRSGYAGNAMGAYMELRDEKVCFFMRTLPRGKHSLAYRMRAEIPGRFSALPTRGYAMYAPELKGNSDEIKLAIED